MIYRILLCFGLLFSPFLSPLSLASMPAPYYLAFSGDLNGDGLLDLMLRQEQAPLLLPYGGSHIPVQLEPHMPELVFLRTAGGGFVLSPPLNPVQQGQVYSWPASPTAVWATDINGDTLSDLYINMGAEFAGAPDLFLYFDGTSGSLPVVKVLDQAVTQFVNEYQSWQADFNYFEQMGGFGNYYSEPRTYLDVSTGYFCESNFFDYLETHNNTPSTVTTTWNGSLDSWFSNCVAFDNQCDANNRIYVGLRNVLVNHVEQTREIDWSLFTPNIEDFVRIITDIYADRVLVAGDPDAVLIVDILETILGAEVMGGVITQPGQRTPEEVVLDDSELDEYRANKLLILLNRLIQAVSTATPEPSPGQFEVVRAYDPDHVFGANAIAYGVNFRVPANSYGVIVQKVSVAANVSAFGGGTAVHSYSAGGGDCPSQTVVNRGDDEFFFYEGWEVLNGRVIPRTPNGLTASLADYANLPYWGNFANDHFVTPNFIVGSSGTYDVLGEVVFFPQTLLSAFPQLSPCKNPRAGILAAEADNVPVIGWPNGFPTNPPPTAALPHNLRVVYGRSGTPKQRVQTVEAIP